MRSPPKIPTFSDCVKTYNELTEFSPAVAELAWANSTQPQCDSFSGYLISRSPLFSHQQREQLLSAHKAEVESEVLTIRREATKQEVLDHFEKFDRGEYDGLKSNATWDEIPKASRTELDVLFPAKWVREWKPQGPPDGGKSRLVAAKPGSQGDREAETKSPTLSKEIMRIQLCVYCSLGWLCHIFGVIQAFLQANRILAQNRNLILIPPKSPWNLYNTNCYWRLNKYIYGLPEAGRQFFKSLAEHLYSLLFSSHACDKGFFFLHADNLPPSPPTSPKSSPSDPVLEINDADWEYTTTNNTILKNRKECKLAGALGMHVDDGLFGGGRQWGAHSLRGLRSRFQFKLPSTIDKFEFLQLLSTSHWISPLRSTVASSGRGS